MRQRVLLLLTLGLLAQPETLATRNDAAALTATDLAVFFDGMIPAELERADIAGATVAVVKDGALLFAKGYGYADVETGKPVIAEATLFRPGSVSKLFVWTAVMQLVEEGRLDLDADVNGYLDFQLPATFPQPITLRHTTWPAGERTQRCSVRWRC